jgi:hypothetical protein
MIIGVIAGSRFGSELKSIVCAVSPESERIMRIADKVRWFFNTIYYKTWLDN